MSKAMTLGTLVEDNEPSIVWHFRIMSEWACSVELHRVKYSALYFTIIVDNRVLCPDESHQCSLNGRCEITNQNPLTFSCLCNDGYIGNGTTCEGNEEHKNRKA